MAGLSHRDALGSRDNKKIFRMLVMPMVLFLMVFFFQILAPAKAPMIGQQCMI